MANPCANSGLGEGGDASSSRATEGASGLTRTATSPARNLFEMGRQEQHERQILLNAGHRAQRQRMWSRRSLQDMPPNTPPASTRSRQETFESIEARLGQPVAWPSSPAAGSTLYGNATRPIPMSPQQESTSSPGSNPPSTPGADCAAGDKTSTAGDGKAATPRRPATQQVTTSSLMLVKYKFPSGPYFSPLTGLEIPIPTALHPSERDTPPDLPELPAFLFDNNNPSNSTPTDGLVERPGAYSPARPRAHSHPEHNKVTDNIFPEPIQAPRPTGARGPPAPRKGNQYHTHSPLQPQSTTATEAVSALEKEGSGSQANPSALTGSRHGVVKMPEQPGTTAASPALKLVPSPHIAQAAVPTHRGLIEEYCEQLEHEASGMTSDRTPVFQAHEFAPKAKNVEFDLNPPVQAFNSGVTVDQSAGPSLSPKKFTFLKKLGFGKRSADTQDSNQFPRIQHLGPQKQIDEDAEDGSGIAAPPKASAMLGGPFLRNGIRRSASRRSVFSLTSPDKDGETKSPRKRLSLGGWMESPRKTTQYEDASATHSALNSAERRARNRSYTLKLLENSLPPTPPEKDTPPTKASTQGAAAASQNVGLGLNDSVLGINVGNEISPIIDPQGPFGSFKFGKASNLVTEASDYSLHASIIPELVNANHSRKPEAQLAGLDVESFGVPDESRRSRSQEQYEYSPSVYSPDQRSEREKRRDSQDVEYTPTKQHRRSRSISWSELPKLPSIFRKRHSDIGNESRNVEQSTLLSPVYTDPTRKEHEIDVPMRPARQSSRGPAGGSPDGHMTTISESGSTEGIIPIAYLGVTSIQSSCDSKQPPKLGLDKEEEISKTLVDGGLINPNAKPLPNVPGIPESVPTTDVMTDCRLTTPLPLSEATKKSIMDLLGVRNVIFETGDVGRGAMPAFTNDDAVKAGPHDSEDLYTSLPGCPPLPRHTDTDLARNNEEHHRFPYESLSGQSSAAVLHKPEMGEERPYTQTPQPFTNPANPFSARLPLLSSYPTSSRGENPYHSSHPLARIDDRYRPNHEVPHVHFRDQDPTLNRLDDSYRPLHSELTQMPRVHFREQDCSPSRLDDSPRSLHPELLPAPLRGNATLPMSVLSMPPEARSCLTEPGKVVQLASKWSVVPRGSSSSLPQPPPEARRNNLQ